MNGQGMSADAADPQAMQLLVIEEREHDILSAMVMMSFSILIAFRRQHLGQRSKCRHFPGQALLKFKAV